MHSPLLFIDGASQWLTDFASQAQSRPHVGQMEGSVRLSLIALRVDCVFNPIQHPKLNLGTLIAFRRSSAQENCTYSNCCRGFVGLRADFETNRFAACFLQRGFFKRT
jgi:hypothetical protein